ncbi:cyclin-dependent kinase [Acrasis kona]|uniref:CDKC-1 n=1 Tax=Acrasis kona TaxID=1008807 RepID=A0AAW2YQD0_9EUKA
MSEPAQQHHNNNEESNNLNSHSQQPHSQHYYQYNNNDRGRNNNRSGNYRRDRDHHRSRNYHNNHRNDHQTPPPLPNNGIPRDKDPTSRFRHFEKTIEDYDKIDKLGEGTYGEVFKARHKHTREVFAVKKVRMDKEMEGFPITAIREISILKSLDHQNIVKLRDVIASKDKNNFFMVFEYVEHDLAGLIDARVPFSEAEVKSIIQQLLEALFHCHAKNILHRDLKASNLLMNKHGCLKLADFGLSRFTQRGRSAYTNCVVTRWYRPPELLMGATDYGPPVDMWSVGCILGELLLNSKAVFPGGDEVDQLDMIFKVCGTPTPENWPDATKLPSYKEPKVACDRVLRKKFFSDNTKWSREAIDLFDNLLQLDPAKRPSAKDCLNHDWFWKNGKPIPPKHLPEKSINELSVKQRKHHPPGQAPAGSSSSQPNVPPPVSHYRAGGNGNYSSHGNSHHNGHRRPHHQAPSVDPNVEPPYKRYKGHRGPPPANGNPSSYGQNDKRGELPPRK